MISNRSNLLSPDDTSPLRTDVKTFLSEQDLADAIRAERVKQGLSQRDVAERLTTSGKYETITQQAVSKAENYKSGDGMAGVRVAAYEVLKGETLTGPVWYRADD